MMSFTIRGSGGDDDPTTSSSPSLENATFLVSAYRTNDRRYLNFNGTELLNMADSGSIDYGSYSNLSAVGGRYTSNNFQSPDGYLNGEIHELIVIDGASATDTLKLEGYLAHKWGLAGNLPNGHLYKSSKPIIGSPPFSTDVASGSGQSLDLSNGVFATVSTGGSEDVFDGDNNFSLSMWVKGWPQGANQHLLSKDISSPREVGDPKLWLDASDDSTIIHSSNVVSQWSDKSGEWQP